MSFNVKSDLWEKNNSLRWHSSICNQISFVTWKRLSCTPWGTTHPEVPTATSGPSSSNCLSSRQVITYVAKMKLTKFFLFYPSNLFGDKMTATIIHFDILIFWKLKSSISDGPMLRAMNMPKNLPSYKPDLPNALRILQERGNQIDLVSISPSFLLSLFLNARSFYKID